MGSINASNVAKEVLENVGKGKKVNLGKILKKNGYAQNTADNPKQVTGTKSYKQVIDPIVGRWKKERERLTTELERRDLSNERYETVMKSIDLATKNIQLLSGGKTENIGFEEVLTEEEISALKALL